MQAEVADRTWRQLRSLADAHDAGPPALHIFKGGGYVLADLVAMLRVTELEAVLRVQTGIQGAHCILAMERWYNGRRVNLRQVRCPCKHIRTLRSTPTHIRTLRSTPTHNTYGHVHVHTLVAFVCSRANLRL